MVTSNDVGKKTDGLKRKSLPRNAGILCQACFDGLQFGAEIAVQESARVIFTLV